MAKTTNTTLLPELKKVFPARLAKVLSQNSDAETFDAWRDEMRQKSEYQILWTIGIGRKGLGLIWPVLFTEAEIAEQNAERERIRYQKKSGAYLKGWDERMVDHICNRLSLSRDGFRDFLRSMGRSGARKWIFENATESETGVVKWAFSPLSEEDREALELARRTEELERAKRNLQIAQERLRKVETGA